MYQLCSSAAHLYHVVVKTHPKWVMKSYVLILRCLTSYSLTRLNSNHEEENIVSTNIKQTTNELLRILWNIGF